MANHIEIHSLLRSNKHGPEDYRRLIQLFTPILENNGFRIVMQQSWSKVAVGHGNWIIAYIDFKNRYLIDNWPMLAHEHDEIAKTVRKREKPLNKQFNKALRKAFFCRIHRTLLQIMKYFTRKRLTMQIYETITKELEHLETAEKILDRHKAVVMEMQPLFETMEELKLDTPTHMRRLAEILRPYGLPVTMLPPWLLKG